MVEQAIPGGTGERFLPYVEELREFFTSRRVAFGRPEDLLPFADQLHRDEGFSEEIGSLLRSIVYQEGEKLGRGELLGVVLTAVTGAALEENEPEHHGAVRQVFFFINTALRQTRFGFEELPGEAEELKDHPAAMEETHPPLRMLPQAGADLPVAAGPLSPPREAPPERREILYRAMALTAEAEMVVPPPAIADAPTDLSRGASRLRASRPWWVIPAVGLGIAALAAGLAAVAPIMRHLRPESPTATAQVVAQQPTDMPDTCAASIGPGVARSGLEERSLWAHNLLAQHLYDAALPELREIARLDPGFPGIRLDESDALLHLKRPEEARDAVDAQIRMSECLGRLPAPALDRYCAAQYATSVAAGCRLRLSHIQQAAELQAALVHLELGHEVEPDGGAAAALAELSEEEARAATPAAAPRRPSVRREVKPVHVSPLPPATEGDTAQPSLSREPKHPSPARDKDGFESHRTQKQPQ